MKTGQTIAMFAVLCMIALGLGYWVGQPPPPPPPPPLEQGLVAYYPFNGNAKDESGNGIDGEVNGAVLTTDRHGKTGKAYSFDGSNTISTTNTITLSSHTFSAWANPFVYPKAGLVGIMAADDSTGNWGQILLESTGQIWVEISKNGAATKLHKTLITINPGRWHLVSYTYDAPSQSLKLYIDGIEQSVTKLKDENISNLKIAEEIRVGIDRAELAHNYFEGSIDDVRIYNRALSVEEIAAIYDQEKPDYSKNLKNGLVAYYPFNGNAKDESGNGYHGALNDGASLTNDRKGAAGRAVSFDGVDDKLTTLYPGNIEHNFSFSFWANPGAATRIIAESNSRVYGGPPGHNGLIYYPSGGSTGEAGIGVNLGTNGITIVEAADNHLPAPLVYAADLAGWMHYAVVVINSRPYLYINGALVREGLQSNKTIFWSDFHGRKIHPGEGIGKGGYGAYAGQMDELRIYNRTLSEAEAKALYEFEKAD